MAVAVFPLFFPFPLHILKHVLFLPRDPLGLLGPRWGRQPWLRCQGSALALLGWAPGEALMQRRCFECQVLFFCNYVS